jgi:tRNA/rRNA methyltransferase
MLLVYEREESVDRVNDAVSLSPNPSPCWRGVNDSSYRVVLVRPAIAGNVGAVARLMRNFGLSQLSLVQPHVDPLSDAARQLSTHGETVLQTARSEPSLERAVGDCVLVVATSAKVAGLYRREHHSPAELMPRVRFALNAQKGPVALVFGPEQTGLTNEEVSLCHELMTIPADPTYPVFNLAQSVAISLYELMRSVDRPTSEQPDLATFEDQQRMFDKLRAGLTDIHFLWGEKADVLWHGLRHLLLRAQLTTQDVKLLLGVARQLEWYTRHGDDSSDPNL